MMYAAACEDKFRFFIYIISLFLSFLFCCCFISDWLFDYSLLFFYWKRRWRRRGKVGKEEKSQRLLHEREINSQKRKDDTQQYKVPQLLRIRQ